MSRLRTIVSLVVFVVVLYGLTFTFSDRFPALRPSAIDDFSDITPIEAPVDPVTAGPEEAPSFPPTPSVGCDVVTLCLNIVGEWVIWFGMAVASFFGMVVEFLADAIDQGIKNAGLFISIVSLDLPLFDHPLLAFFRLAVLSVVSVTVGFIILESLRKFIPFLPGGD